jgi:glycosyltransferase involved in cell wall biosynthesis
MMLSWEYPPRIVGGISPHVYDLSKQLVRLGIEVHVVTKETPLAPDEEVEASGVHVHRVHLEQKPNDFVHEIQLLNDATEIRVRELLEDWRRGGQPTIFHAHDWLSLDAARELKYEYMLPMVATVHATEEGRNGGIHNDMQAYIHEQEYWLTYEAWRVIICSEFMRGEVIRSFNVPYDKTDVVFNGVDAHKFEFDWTDAERDAWKAKFAQPDEKVVVYVGRFVREKGIHVLLDAASAVLAKEPKAKFVIVGGGMRDKYERFVQWYGLSDKVVFTGFMANRNLYSMYRIADVAVFPSLYEPFGIVALEAMASGAPVVTSDAGGLSEVVLHDRTGTISYAGDPNSLAWAILRVLQDPARAFLLGENARERLGTDFDWARIAAQTADVYQRVWTEFLDSYWADGSLWPVTPGAEERAEKRKVRQKTKREAMPMRPRPSVAAISVPSTLDHEEQVSNEAANVK